jgi:hypothetical protein
MSTAAQQKFDQTLSRLDSALDSQLRRVEKVEARIDAEREAARAQRMRDNAEQRREIQATYADAYRSFGTEVPMPVDDEPVAAFRKRLFNRLARKLAPDHELSNIRADDVSSSPTVFNHFENEMIKAAALEGEQPSEANLPDDGGLVMRTRTDDMGEKSINWYGKQSFIRGMGRPGRPVERIVDRKTGNCIWGRPFSTR